MSSTASDPEELLRRSLQSQHLHSAYLLSGPGEAPRQAALRFVRALVCEARGTGPCEACSSCRRSQPPEEEIVLDGNGKRGPLLRHVGDHPDLLWVERGPEDTRVRIGQIRAIQHAFRLRSHEGGFRSAVVADAEWLNLEAQNALLRLLEEPPDRTTLVLVAASSAGLLPTVRSRCQRVGFPTTDPATLVGPEAPEETRALLARLAAIPQSSTPELLDWAEEFRGPRASAAPAVEQLLETASLWLHSQVREAAQAGRTGLEPELGAFATLQNCRKVLAQRNANPQMVAERSLLALREALR